MEEKTVKKRAWIKNVVIVFLAVLLLLTFFSNTIMNRSLPQVAAQYAQSGTITTKIKGQGTVSANRSYQVSIDETRLIKSVAVKTGDIVQKGDTLFELEDSESEELKTAQSNLKNLRMQYEKALLTLPKDYTDMLAEIDEATAQLAKAKAAKAAIPTAGMTYAAAREAVKTAEKSAAELKRKITALNEKLSAITFDDDIDMDGVIKLISDASSGVESIKKQLAVEEAALAKLSDALALADAALEKATQDKDNADADKADFDALHGTAPSVTEESLVSKQREIARAEIAIARAEKEYDRVLAEQQIESVKLRTALNNAKLAEAAALAERDRVYADENATDEEKSAAQQAYEAARTASSQANDALLSQALSASGTLDNLRNGIDDQELSLKYLREDYQADKKALEEWNKNAAEREKLDAAVSAAAQTLQTAKKSQREAKTRFDAQTSKVTSIKTALDKAQAELKKYTDNSNFIEYTDQLDRLNTALEDKNSELEVLREDETQAKENASLTPEKADENIAAIQKTLESKTRQLERQRQSDQIDEKISGMELDVMKDNITEAEKEVERLRSKAVGATVTAAVGGVISSVSVVAGEKAAAGAVIAEIDIAGKGYSISFTVTNEQSRRIKEGDYATVQYYYWGETPVLQVTSIRADAQNPTKNKTVTLSVTGEVTVGTQLDFTLGEKGSSYDAIVPNSAVREDNNGKFVLIVEAKSTPLGNRYTARRCPVEVLASDGTSSAVSGLSAYGEFVITTATKPVSAGSQVRLSENN